MTELSERPWQNICMDFYGPLPSEDYILGTLDKYSCFPEIEILQSESALAAISLLDKVFSSRGVWKNDNGLHSEVRHSMSSQNFLAVSASV